MGKKLNFLLMCGLGLAAASTAKASGYQLNEYSVTNLGRAFAGVGVVGDDYSAIAFNPAGMTLKGSGGQLGVSVVEMNSDTRGKLNLNGGGVIGDSPKGRLRLYKVLPHGFGQYKINDKAYVGLGVYSPFGLASKYNAYWFGANHGIRTELEVVDVAASFAYKFTNQWSAGGAVIYRYVHGNLINTPSPLFPKSRNQMDLDGWGWAYNFGVMYEPVQDTRFGVAYRLNSGHTVKGKHKIKKLNPAVNGAYPAETTMTLPNQLTLSAYHKLNSKFGLSGTARWTKWDVFDDFVLHSQYNGGTTEIIPENWKNVWTFSAGVDYYYSPEWTFRFGVSTDPTPIKSPEFRTARIPDADRTWTTLGVSYKYNNMTFDVGYAHLFMKTAEIRNRNAVTTLNAKAVGLSNMYAIQFQYDF
ncbi:MAG: OmpP1/FadL family transporter [Lactobacillaceae bacterium]|jgi:long-chain fatty acid transport protein|nr:OmpP1/FadL family transporter [Lactobacillaceae bacterium]